MVTISGTMVVNYGKLVVQALTMVVHVVGLHRHSTTGGHHDPASGLLHRRHVVLLRRTHLLRNSDWWLSHGIGLIESQP